MTPDEALELWNRYGKGETFWTFEFAKAVEKAAFEKAIALLDEYGLGTDFVTRELRRLAGGS